MTEVSRIYTIGSTSTSTSRAPNPLARWLILIVAAVVAVPLLGLAIIVGTIAVAAFAVLLLVSALTRRVQGFFDRGPQRENVRVRRPD